MKQLRLVGYRVIKCPFCGKKIVFSLRFRTSPSRLEQHLLGHGIMINKYIDVEWRQTMDYETLKPKWVKKYFVCRICGWKHKIKWRVIKHILQYHKKEQMMRSEHADK